MLRTTAGLKGSLVLSHPFSTAQCLSSGSRDLGRLLTQACDDEGIRFLNPWPPLKYEEVSPKGFWGVGFCGRVPFLFSSASKPFDCSSFQSNIHPNYFNIFFTICTATGVHGLGGVSPCCVFHLTVAQKTHAPITKSTVRNDCRFQARCLCVPSSTAAR